MVKKTEFKTGAGDDLDSFLNDTSGFGDIDLSPGSSKGKKSRFATFSKGTISGIGSTLKSPSFLARQIGNVIPDKYGSATEDASEIYRTMYSLYGDAVREVKPGFQQISRQIDKLVPDEQKTLKKFTTKLKELTGATEPGEEVSPEQLREQGINTALGQIFALQAEQNAKERVRDKAEDTIDKQVDMNRFNANYAVFASMSTSLNRLAAYNDQINQAYQKKSLELQYRSLFVQTDLLATTRSLYETLGKQNNELIRLSAMSDAEKTTDSVRYQKSIATKFFGAGDTGMLSARKYKDAVKDKLTRIKQDAVATLKGGIESTFMGLDAFQAMKEQMAMGSDLGVSNDELLGNMLGSLGTDFIASFLTKKYKNKIIPPGSGRENMVAKAASKVLDLPNFAKELKESKYLEDNGRGGLVGKGKDLLRSALGIFTNREPDMTLASEKINLTQLNSPAAFTYHTQKSITTVIPGYLARILREIQITRTGDLKTPMTEFNYTNNRFMSSTRLMRGMRRDLLEMAKNSGYSYYNSEVMDKLIGKAMYSPEALEALKQRSQDISFNPTIGLGHKAYLDENWLSTLSPEVASEIYENISNRYKYNEKQGGINEYDLINASKRARNAIPDIREMVENNSRMGYGDTLRKLDLTKKNKFGETEVNISGFRKYVTSDSSGLLKPAWLKTLPEETASAMVEGMKNKFAGFNYTGSLKEIYYYARQGDTDALIRCHVLKVNEKTGAIEPNVTRSDYNVKTGFTSVDDKGILSKFKNIFSKKWKYRDGDDTSEMHVGPMAQDIRKNFGEEYAPGGKKIDLISLNGASMSAIAELAREQDKLKKAKGSTDVLYSINRNVEAILALMAEKAPSEGTREKGGDDLSGLGHKAMDHLKKGGNRLYESGVYAKDKMADFAYVNGGVFNAFIHLLREALDKAVGYSKSAGSYLKRKGGEAIDYWNNTAYPATHKFITEKAMPSLERLVSGTKNAITNTLNPIVDVYVKGRKEPALYAHLLKQGQYVNAESKKVIKTLGDITGPVTDLDGRIVLTRRNIIKGLVDVKGNPIKDLRETLYDHTKALMKQADLFVTEKIPAAFQKVRNAGRFLIDTVKNELNAPRDIYIPGRKKPVLYASLINAGEYIDEKTGKVIRTLDDIKGPVINTKGDIVLSINDIAKGLYDVNGDKIESLNALVRRKTIEAVSKGHEIISGLAKGGFGKIKEMAGKFKLGQGFSMPGNKRTNTLLTEIRDILLFANPDYTGSVTEGPVEEEVEGTKAEPTTAKKTEAPSLKAKKASIERKAKKLSEAKDKAEKTLTEAKTKLKAAYKKGAPKIIEEAKEKASGIMGETTEKVKQARKKLEGIAKKRTSGKKKETEADYSKDMEAAEADLAKMVEEDNKGSKKPFSLTRLILKNAVRDLRILGFLGKAVFKTVGFLGKLGLKAAGFLAKLGLKGIWSGVKGIASLPFAPIKYLGKRVSALLPFGKKEPEEEEVKKESLMARIRKHIPGLEKGTDVSGVKKAEEAYAKQREKLESNVAKVEKAKHEDGFINKLIHKLGGLLGKGIKLLTSGLLGGFKKIAGGLGKMILGGFKGVFSKIPGIGRLFGAGAEVAEAGGIAAEGAAVAGGAAEAGTVAAAAAGGGGILATAGGALAAVGSFIASPVVLGTAALAAIGYGAYKGYKYITRDDITPIDNLRMAQYGLTPALKSHYHEILNLEGILLKEGIVYNNGKAALKPSQTIGKAILDVFNISPKDTTAVNNLMKWFQYRFKPVFLTNLTVLNQIDSSTRLDRLDTLKSSDKIKYINAAKYPDGPYGQNTSPFIDLPALPDTRLYVNKVYDWLLKMYTPKKDDLKEQTHLDKWLGSSNMLARAYDYSKKKAIAAKAATATAAVKTAEYLKAKTAKTEAFTKQQVKAAEAAAAPTINAIGKEIAPVTDFATRSFDKVKSMVMDGSKLSVMKIIKTAAESLGLPASILETMAAIESGFNPNAKAPTSSATGLFQFIRSTWHNMLAKYGPKFGLSTATPPTDPKASALIGAQYLKDNLAVLKTVKPNPTPTDGYLAHFLGPAGAKTILTKMKSDPNAIASQILPAAAKANRTLFYDRSGNAFTVAEFYANMDHYVKSKAQAYGIAIPTTAVATNVKNTTMKNTVAANDVSAAAASKPSNIPAPTPALNASHGEITPVAPKAKEKTATTSPVFAMAKKPSVESGQGFDMNKMHSSVGNIHSTLSDSLEVQKQMLNGINKLVDKMSPKNAQTATQTTAKGPAVAEAKPLPNPSIDLSRKAS